MEIGTILQNFPPLVFCPDHEGVHGPLDVGLPLALRVLPVLSGALTWRGSRGHQLWLGQQRGGRGSSLGRGGGGARVWDTHLDWGVGDARETLGNTGYKSGFGVQFCAGHQQFGPNLHVGGSFRPTGP